MRERLEELRDTFYGVRTLINMELTVAPEPLPQRAQMMLKELDRVLELTQNTLTQEIHNDPNA